MRRPSPFALLYAWHAAALAGERLPVVDCDPRCGWFRTTLVRGGPFVGARIWVEQEIDPETGELTAPEEFRCEVHGRRRDPYHSWFFLAGRPISEADFLALTERTTRGAMHERAVEAPVDLTAHFARP